MPDRDRQLPAAPPGSSPWAGSAPVLPQLRDVQFTRIAHYGVPQSVSLGDIVFGPGDADYDVILIESGWIEILSPATDEEPESVVGRYGAGGFLGELHMLTGQTAGLLARVTEHGRIHRITRAQFRRLLSAEPELSDVVVRAFLARRNLRRGGPASRW
jgi:thioredoxin reductase (NADPH)